jgi:hypothetical protein
MFDDHKHVRAAILSLEAHVATRGEVPAPEWIAELTVRVKELDTFLKSHFSKEEHSDLYSKYPEEFPRFAESLSDLKAQHVEIIRDLEDLILILSGAMGTGPKLDVVIDSITSKLGQVTSLIRDHEAQETKILHAAMPGAV